MGIVPYGIGGQKIPIIAKRYRNCQLSIVNCKNCLHRQEKAPALRNAAKSPAGRFLRGIVLIVKISGKELCEGTVVFSQCLIVEAQLVADGVVDDGLSLKFTQIKV